jgi:hypothetical protein
MVSRIGFVALAVLTSALWFAEESFAQCNNGPGGSRGSNSFGRGGQPGGFGQGNTTAMFNRPGGPRLNNSSMFGQGNVQVNLQYQLLVQQQQRLQLQNLIIQQQQQYNYQNLVRQQQAQQIQLQNLVARMAKTSDSELNNLVQTSSQPMVRLAAQITLAQRAKSAQHD